MSSVSSGNGFGLGIGMDRAAVVDNSVDKSPPLAVEARFDEPAARRMRAACEQFD